MCGSSGDGGAAERQAQMKAEQDAAILRVNEIFGKGDGVPQYTTSSGVNQVSDGDRGFYEEPWSTQTLTGYDTTTRDKNAADREALYSTIQGDASARLLDKLNKDRTSTERGSRFQLARQGLSGGSADIDLNTQILDRYNEGALEAGNAALASANQARSADEQTRTNIINNIRNGLAESDAISSAYSALSNNANEARDNAMATDIGSFFTDINNLNQQRQYNAGLQAGRSMYSPGAGVSSGRAYGGSISQ